MREFKVKDRVKCVNPDSLVLNGKTGVVRKIFDYSDYMAVEFDDFVYGGTCNGACKNGFGKYVEVANFVLLNGVDVEKFYRNVKNINSV